MKKRIFWSILLYAMAAALVLGGVVLIAQYRIDEARIYEELSAECGYVGAGLTGAEDERAFLAGLTPVNRVTLVTAGGDVAFDSAAKPGKLENHLSRPEIRDALETGEGKSARYSDTQLTKNLYYARRLGDGRVLRVATSQKTVLGMLRALLLPVALILLLIAGLSVPVSRLLAERIVRPVNGLDLDHPLQNNAYDEIAPLLTRMERQRREIQLQMEQLTEKQREFSAVTDHMREGLLLLDGRERVLTMNKSAAAVFHADREAAAGQFLLTVNRGPALLDAVKRARTAGAGEETLVSDGRTYRVLANAVEGEAGGTVVLLLDMTEEQAAEQSRRVFTANVSHELKTPLTSISGYAEILRDGLTRPEDVRPFAGKIYDEANRLITLIGDIIRLSQLDEKRGLPERVDCDLLDIAEKAVARLRPEAERAGVSLTLSGVHAAIRGIPKLLDEMVFNLAENAVKYNRPDGAVTVAIDLEDGRPVLRVSDTGVGIPEEEQARVFERFYRVDRSRTKTTGGTGLGLSIVKHGAELHGARIALVSRPGEGTTVELHFRGEQPG